jgi:hypothetical protein
MKSIRLILEDAGIWAFKFAILCYFIFALGVLAVCVFKFIKEATL